MDLKKRTFTDDKKTIIDLIARGAKEASDHPAKIGETMHAITCHVLEYNTERPHSTSEDTLVRALNWSAKDGEAYTLADDELFISGTFSLRKLRRKLVW